VLYAGADFKLDQSTACCFQMHMNLLPNCFAGSAKL